jgi:integrase
MLSRNAISRAGDGLPSSADSFLHAKFGESVKTVQAILGHSELETTLNIYMHAIPDSQRRAVERVAGVLFPDVPKLASGHQSRRTKSVD